MCRGLHSLTKQCPAVKLFSKHLKVEEQVVFYSYKDASLEKHAYIEREQNRKHRLLDLRQK